MKIILQLLKDIKTTIQIIIGFIICFPLVLDSKTDYLLSVFSTGDTLIMGGFISAYKEAHPGRRVKVIVKKNHKQIVEFNSDRIGTPIYISTKLSLFIRPFFIVASNMSDRFRFCMHDKTLYRLDHDAAARITCFGLWPCYKRIFSLPAKTTFLPPNYSALSDEEYKEFTERLSIDPRKTFILAPYTITMQEYNYTPLFTRIAKALNDSGWDVYTNTTDERCIEGTKALRLDFNEIVSLAQNNNIRVISVRSGLCDLLRFTGCKLTVVYPSMFWKDMFCVKTMFGDRDGMSEIIVSPKTGKVEDILEEKNEDTFDK